MIGKGRHYSHFDRKSNQLALFELRLSTAVKYHKHATPLLVVGCDETSVFEAERESRGILEGYVVLEIVCLNKRWNELLVLKIQHG